MAVLQKDILKHQIETMHFIIRKTVDDISEDEALTTVGSSPNHIKWQTGHLVSTAKAAGNILGADIALPEGWTKMFARGAEPPEKQKDLPPMDELRSTLYDYQKQVLAQLEKVSEEYLETTRHIAPNWEDSPLNAVLFLCGHDFYHCGQIALIRRELGRTRNFG